MAPIAALYDIHGNAPALRAVLAEVALVPGAHVVVSAATSSGARCPRRRWNWSAASRTRR